MPKIHIGIPLVNIQIGFDVSTTKQKAEILSEHITYTRLCRLIPYLFHCPYKNLNSSSEIYPVFHW